MDEVQNYMLLIKELVVGLVAVFATYIAWRGLGAWRSQLYGSYHHEVARRVAVATLELRDEIKAFRAWLLAYTMLIPAKDFFNEIRNDNIAKLLFERCHEWVYRIEEKRLKLNEAMAEAEIIWGDNLTPAVSELNYLQNELKSEIEYAKLVSEDKILGDGGRIQGFLRESRAIRRLSDENDNDFFNTELNLAVSKIKSALKPSLMPVS
ncbi:hypothetical protein [Marinimicrobium sp. ABcell2]|uniref:hypothetical protein n=1 Tax=Marinimicrobium sp. ABcell2 TaxID=3069751 RepID=UPI0027B55E6F|nr:hypothetical protein [Marinimicrobium sp. ABcell2]MDQ2077502.1 hypothetical protein [Marinimicrobium sp. ABcell2]